MEIAGIIILVVVMVFLVGFGFVMYKIYSDRKKKEFEKKTDAKRGMEKNSIESREIEILNSIDPNDPEDAKKKLEIVAELDKLNKKNQ